MFAFTLKSKLKRKKKFVLLEVTKDIEYIEKFKSDALYYDETAARKRFAELKKKEELTDDEEVEKSRLEDEIANSVAVKNEFEKSDELRDELEDYISLL